MDKSALQPALLLLVLGLGWVFFTDTWLQNLYPEELNTAFAEAQTVIRYLSPFLLSGVVYVSVFLLNHKLRRRSKHLYDVFDTIPQPIFIVEADTLAILAINSATLDRYGYDKGPLLRMTLRDISQKGDHIRLEDELSSIRQGSSYVGLSRLVDRQGNASTVKLHGHVIRFNGKSAWLVLALDVEDLVQKEQRITALNQELADFRFAIDRATIMGTINEEGRFTYVNDNMVQISRYLRNQIIGQPFTLTVNSPPEDRQILFDSVMEVLQDHRIWRGEVSHLTADGEPYWTKAYGIPFNQQSGKLTEAIFICTDITEQKRSEEATQQREEYLRSLVQSQSSYLIRTDLEGKFTFANKQFTEMFSFLAEDFIGLPYMDTIHPDDFDACQQMAMTCIQEPGRIVPLQIRKPDGNGGNYFTDWEFVGIQNADGEVMEIQGIGQDATERLKNERHILNQNKLLRQIAWISSHELRRPVANILSLTTLIQSSQAGAHELVNPLASSVQDLDKIIRVIVQMLYELDIQDKEAEADGSSDG